MEKTALLFFILLSTIAFADNSVATQAVDHCLEGYDHPFDKESRYHQSYQRMEANAAGFPFR